MLKKIVIAFFAMVLSVSIFAETKVLDKVVAVVNNEVITQQQLNQAISMITTQYQQAGQPVPDSATLRKNALDGLIAESLQIQVAKKNNVKITDVQLNKAITEIAQRNNLTVDQLKTELQKQGMSYSQYQAQIRKQMLISTLQQQALGGQVHVTDAEINEVIKKAGTTAQGNTSYHVVDISLSVKDDASEATWKEYGNLANQLYAQLQQKTDMATLQKRFPNLQTQDLGWRELSGFPDVFVDSIKSLKANSYSKPIKTGNGFHILYLQEIKQPGQTISREQARQIAFQAQLQKALAKWIGELRAQSYVKVMN